MAKSEYRRFKIKFHENKPDDFAMMREVLTRRLQEAVQNNPRFNRLPNLIIVDGGKGQVSAAVSAIESTGFAIPEGSARTIEGPALLTPHTSPLTPDHPHASRITHHEHTPSPLTPDDPHASRVTPHSSRVTPHALPHALPLAGLAKRFELLILPNEPDPVALPRNCQALYLVQRIRDEAHRFANAYRATLQTKKQTRSLLDGVPGIGPTRRKALLKAFGSLDAIRRAGPDELASVPKMSRSAADAVYHYLQTAP